MRTVRKSAHSVEVLRVRSAISQRLSAVLAPSYQTSVSVDARVGDIAPLHHSAGILFFNGGGPGVVDPRRRPPRTLFVKTSRRVVIQRPARAGGGQAIALVETVRSSLEFYI